VYGEGNPILNTDTLGLSAMNSVINAINRFRPTGGSTCGNEPPNPCKSQQQAYEQQNKVFLDGVRSGSIPLKQYMILAPVANAVIKAHNIRCPEYPVQYLPIPPLVGLPTPPVAPPPQNPPPS